MSTLKDYEVRVIRTLTHGHLSEEILSAVIADATHVSYEHTGVGYFLKVSHKSLPIQRIVCSEPLLIGRSREVECGFVIFLERRELVIECHSWVDSALPSDIREHKIEIHSRRG